MASLEEIRQIRLEKLKALEEAGINPYPVSTRRNLSCEEAKREFDTLSNKGEKRILAGRILSLREQGKIIFFDLDDGTARLQAMLRMGDPLSEKDFEFFRTYFDIGDFIEVEGTLFLTKKEEKTVLVESFRILAKSLRPLPEKWHGLQDVEERFRKRYLDILSNPDVKDRFIMRSRILSLIRRFYMDEGYIEVDLPNLQPLAGGATAAPFKTRHNALDMEFFLPVAQELYLKELLVGGMNKVFEIGKRFRNEGIDTTHNPEFTMLESNEAYADAESQRDFIERLFKYLVKNLFEQYRFEYEDNILDFEPEFRVIKFYDLLRDFADIPEPENLSRDGAKGIAENLGVRVEKEDALEKILDNIYKKVARPNLIQPTFIVDYPVSFNPFAKRREDDPTIIDRFQLVVAGAELVNAFSELNNPLDQKERYLEQDKKGEKGEREISPSDMEYLEAMEYGMPPNGGIGIGIDRLIMLLTNVKNIKEVIIFPTLKPRN